LQKRVHSLPAVNRDRTPYVLVKNMIGKLNSALCAAFIAAVMLTPGAVSPKGVLACTGGYSGFEEYSRLAGAVAVVDVITAGGVQNNAPPLIPLGSSLSASPSPSASPTPTWTATPSGPGANAPTPAVPTPSPTVTPEGPPDFRAGRQLPFDLTGYGARLRVTELVAGSLPSIVEIDGSVRRGFEQQMRYLEAYPGYVLPCPLGFLAYRYAAGQRYLLFLGLERDEWYTMVRLRLRGDQVLISQASLDYYTPSLVVGGALRQAFFADLPAENLPANSPGPVPLMSDKWLIESESVSLDIFGAAVLEVRSVDPASTSPSNTGAPSIRPPDTGDGGLVRLHANP